MEARREGTGEGGPRRFRCSTKNVGGRCGEGGNHHESMT